MRRRLFFAWLRVLRWLGYRVRAEALAQRHALKHMPKVAMTVTANVEQMRRSFERAARHTARLRKAYEQ